MTLLSVISSSSAQGSRPDAASTWPMPLARSGSRNWRGERLTLITRFSSGQRWRQSCAWRHAFSRITRPMATISSDSSARAMKSTGRTRPRDGCCQRASASKPTTRSDPQVQDRLVVDRQLVALERGPQLRLDVEALEGVPAAERIEHRDAPGRVALRADERDLRLLEHVAAAGAARRADRDAHARADEPGAAVEVERRLELELDALGERRAAPSGSAVRQQDRERVAAESRHRVVRPDDTRDARCRPRAGRGRRRRGRGSR